jgi:RNA polymerase sigma-70 factor (ECF subfamily)
MKDQKTDDEPSDVTLVGLAQEGNIEAFETLVERYHSRIYSLTYQMTSNREDAEDLTQEIFIKALQALPKFKGKSSFYTWLYRIGINKTINYRKKRNRRRPLSLDSLEEEKGEGIALREGDKQCSPDRDMRLQELKVKLNEAIDTLSEKHRTVVIMHDIEGVKHEEIAKIVGVSVGTVRSRLFYARQQLQAALGEFIK